MHHRFAGLVAAAIVAVVLTSPLDAQVRRPLQSRAAFAALDSVDLADSAAMRPMDRRAPRDSVMLEMLSFLERGSVGGSGMTRIRMRKWDGYGSQAHPELGILIDSLELDSLFDRVRQLEGTAGVSRSVPEQRLPHILRFLVAHEYAHLLQYRAFGEGFVNGQDSTRIVECGADLVAGFSYGMYLGYKSEWQSRKDAYHAVQEFGYLVGSPDWLDGTQHPLPDNRMLCIGTGFATGYGFSGLQAVRAGIDDSGAVAIAGEFESEEPDLASGKVTLIEWSRTMGRSVGTFGGAVVDGSRTLDVVRDSSVSLLVRSLADAAVRGPQALRLLRSEPSPADSSEILLRQSLAPPWRCLARERLGAEEATCSRLLRAGAEERKAIFEDLIKQVESGLERGGWRRASAEAEATLLAHREERGPIAVFMQGRKPDDLEYPQVTISLSGSELFSIARLPALYQLSLVVRSRAAAGDGGRGGP